MRGRVLVVGAGLAGAAAALEAAELGADVLLVAAAAGSSPRAQGGIAAALGPDDSPRLHAADTQAAGAGLSHPEVVRDLTAAGPEAIAWLAARGVRFAPEPGREAAHSRARVWHAGGDRSGAGIMQALETRLAAQPRITRRRDHLLALTAGGARLAAAGKVEAAAVVLATGGYAGLFGRTSNARVNDGQGIVAGLDAGARVADLEFVQFHPTVFAGPGRPFLVTEAMRGAGARLRDSQGRRFVDELATRAEVALAMASRPDCFLDATAVPDLARRFPSFWRSCRQAGLDPAREWVPVAPAAHYTMGGLVTDRLGFTGVPGLFAAGECARIGLHGANRLASNSLLEAVVMGRRAGAAAARSSSGLRPLATPAAAVGRGDLTAGRVRAILSDAAGIVRTAEGLEAGLSELARGRPASAAARSSRRLALLILEAALERRESVGAHYRADTGSLAAAG